MDGGGEEIKKGVELSKERCTRQELWERRYKIQSRLIKITLRSLEEELAVISSALAKRFPPE